MRRIDIDYYELSKIYDEYGWVVEDIKNLEKLRNYLSKEINKLWREERKVFPPWTPEEKKKYEEILNKRMELEKLRKKVTYRWLRLEKKILEELKKIKDLGVITDDYENIRRELYNLFREISNDVPKNFVAEVEYPYIIDNMISEADIELYKLKKIRADMLNIWVKIQVANHTFSTPGKGGRERHFECYVVAYVPFAYVKYDFDKGRKVSYMLNNKDVTNIDDYFSRLIEQLLLKDENTAFLITFMGFSGEDLVGGVDVAEIFILESGEEEPNKLYARIYDHDYGIDRFEIYEEVPEDYWLIPPSELADEL